MTTGWFIRKSLLDAGFSKSEARCAVEGVAAHLTPDQLWSVRGPLVGYIILDDPPTPMDIDQLLSWLRLRVSPDIHQVIAHYATHCRSPGS